MGAPATSTAKKLWTGYCRFLRYLVLAFALASGVGIITMMTVVCADVILRIFSRPLVGALDIVKIAGALTLAFALPYTTAVKGHVAVEYFFHKLNPAARVIIDTILRVLASILFCFLGYRTILYGRDLHLNQQVSLTLQMPIFWVPCIIGICCFVVVLVIIYNLVNPGKQLVKP